MDESSAMHTQSVKSKFVAARKPSFLIPFPFTFVVLPFIPSSPASEKLTREAWWTTLEEIFAGQLDSVCVCVRVRDRERKREQKQESSWLRPVKGRVCASTALFIRAANRGLVRHSRRERESRGECFSTSASNASGNGKLFNLRLRRTSDSVTPQQYACLCHVFVSNLHLHLAPGKRIRTTYTITGKLTTMVSPETHRYTSLWVTLEYKLMGFYGSFRFHVTSEL